MHRVTLRAFCLLHNAPAQWESKKEWLVLHNATANILNTSMLTKGLKDKSRFSHSYSIIRIMKISIADRKPAITYIHIAKPSHSSYQ